MSARWTGPGCAGQSDVEIFRRALVEAERTFDSALAGDPTARLIAPMLHTAACHNLAAALVSIGEGEEARRLRLRMLSRLVELAVSPSCPLPLRINCVRHMKRAVALLLASSGADEEQDAVTALIAQAQRVAADVVRIAEHALGRGRAPDADARPPAFLH